MTRRGRLALALASSVTAICLSGCGSTEARSSAADEVPALAVSLGKVDDAMAARRFAVAERLLRQLIADVRGYREAGDLDSAAASDIVAAARRLLAELAQRDGAATDLPSATTDGADDGDAATDEATRRPRKSRDSEPTPGTTPEPTDPATPAPSETAAPLDPTPTAETDPATVETPAASEEVTPAAATSP